MDGAEQDPSDWSEAAISTIKSVVEKGQVNGKDVRGIGISGQMHGLVMLNEENQVIRRSIIWCDQRATKQVEEMLELPMEKWMKITANPPMAGWTAAKILWIRENEPELFAKCRHIMLPKDYVRFILTGKICDRCIRCQWNADVRVKKQMLVCRKFLIF